MEEEENLTDDKPAFSRFAIDQVGTDEEVKLGREERYRTVISGMEPRRIAEVMLLPRTDD